MYRLRSELLLGRRLSRRLARVDIGHFSVLVSVKAIRKILLLSSSKTVCYDAAMRSDIMGTTIDRQAFIPICALQ